MGWINKIKNAKKSCDTATLSKLCNTGHYDTGGLLACPVFVVVTDHAATHRHVAVGCNAGPDAVGRHASVVCNAGLDAVGRPASVVCNAGFNAVGRHASVVRNAGPDAV